LPAHLRKHTIKVRTAQSTVQCAKSPHGFFAPWYSSQTYPIRKSKQPYDLLYRCSISKVIKNPPNSSWVPYMYSVYACHAKNIYMFKIQVIRISADSIFYCQRLKISFVAPYNGQSAFWESKPLHLSGSNTISMYTSSMCSYHMMYITCNSRWCTTMLQHDPWLKHAHGLYAISVCKEQNWEYLQTVLNSVLLNIRQLNTS
jgi:hypothetical protein